MGKAGAGDDAPAGKSRPPKARSRKGRRARGTGSIFQKPDGTWVGRKPVGRSPTGKTLYVERWGDTQREVIEKLAAAMPPDPAKETVAGWAARWRQTMTGRKGTAHQYDVSIDQHIAPALGGVRLAALTILDVERFIAGLGAAGMGKGTIRKVVGHLRTILQAAVVADLMPKNPAAHARRPRHEPDEITTYTPDQLATIIGVAPRFAAGGVVATLAATGMRIGEVVALDATDWNGTTISITKTWTLRFGVGPPKSKNSRRTITAPEVLRPVLDNVKGDRTTGPLFESEEGNRRRARSVLKGWLAIVKAAGVPYKRMHDLRHSVITHLVAAGVPVADVAAFAGDTVATIVKTYVHPTGANPAHALNRLYGGRKVGGDLPPAATASRARGMVSKD